MKFTADPHTLADAVAYCARALPSRPTYPALAGILIRASSVSNTLTVSTYDYDVSTQATIDDANVADTGRALVSGRRLASIVASLPAEPVDVEVDGPQLQITCGRATFHLRTMNTGDYPEAPDMPGLAGTIEAATFADAVRSVAPAADNGSAAVPALTAVHVTATADTLTFAATNKYILAIRTLPWQPFGDHVAMTALIPARTLTEVARQLTGTTPINVHLQSGDDAGSGVVGFESDTRKTTTRLLGGDVPKYESLFPRTTNAEGTVETADLVEVVKRIMVVADEKAPIRLSFAADGLTVEAGGIDTDTATEVLSVDYSGEPGTVAVNPHYLLDAMQSLGSDTATFRLVSPVKPITITGKRDDLRLLLMPIRLS